VPTILYDPPAADTPWPVLNAVRLARGDATDLALDVNDNDDDERKV
jgi:hypothetical protein